MARFVPHRRLVALLLLASALVLVAVLVAIARRGEDAAAPQAPPPAAHAAPEPAATQRDAAPGSGASAAPAAAATERWLPVRVCDYLDDSHVRPLLGEASIVTRPDGTDTRTPSCRWWPYEGAGSLELRLELDPERAAAQLAARRSQATPDHVLAELGDGALRHGTTLAGTARGVGFVIDVAPDAVAGPDAIVAQLPALGRVVVAAIERDLSVAAARSTP